MHHTLTAAARFRASMIEALDDSASELEKLRSLGATEADAVTSRAVTAWLRRSTPDERLALASSPDALALAPGNLVPFPRR